MDRKIKNTIILSILLLIILAGGFGYTYFIQGKEIDAKNAQIEELKLNAINPNDLNMQLDQLRVRANELDSILNLRKYNIPVNLSQTSFYDFVNEVSSYFSPFSHVNVEFSGQTPGTNFNFYTYTLSGTANFNDFYKLVYAIEKSKSLKKITDASVTNLVKVDDESIPHYLVNFKITALTYYANTPRYASATFKENKLNPQPVYNLFFPLIRNEIPPNVDNLLDVQEAELLALVPEGAFISDSKGNTFLLWEGDKVYLGYLTKINYQTSEVDFILNKGGIIERITLSLLKEEIKKSK